MTNVSLSFCCLALLAVASARMPRDDGTFNRRTIHKNIKLRTEKEDAMSLRARSLLSRDSNPHEAALDSSEHREWLIHVKGPVHSSLTEKLRQALAVDEVKYVPEHTFVAFTNGNAIRRAREELQEIVWTGVVMPHHKVSPELHPLVLSDTSSLRDMTDDAPSVEVFVVLSQPLEHKSMVADLDWEARLQEVVPYAKAHPLQVRSATRGDGQVRKLVIRMREDQAGAALQFLAEQHLTAWVERKERHRMRNKWAKGILQSGTANQHSIWGKGLQGQGEVLGIADTGVDMHHCFFSDGTHSTPVNRVNNQHRKIISYRYEAGWGNTIDEEGHGSHTTGSLIGQTAHSPEKEYNGMAPQGKVVIDDIFKDDTLAPPDDLEADLYPEPYQIGARIRSESWGGDSMFYTSSARETDSFSRKHRDFLAVWAGGNDGDLGMFTIGSPATAKNMLVVGAQQSTAESLLLQTSDTMFFKAKHHGLQDVEVLGRWAEFGPKGHLDAKIKAAQPKDACRALAAGSMRGKIALVQRGTCFFTDKAKAAQTAGAVGMVVYDNQLGATVSMAGQDSSITIPCVSISRADGQQILTMIQEAGELIDVTTHVTGPDMWQQNLADFSGKGPTGDGRMMPHILTVGASIFSAKSGQRCNGHAPPNAQAAVTDMDGTSMAAPVAAGGTALVRQYFREGWYPSGEKKSKDSFIPSGALLRAAIIGSGQALSGALDVSGTGDNQWEALDRRLPNNQQGYGSMNLERMLYFKERLTHSPKAMYAVDDGGGNAGTCLNTGEAVPLAFSVRASQAFRVSLAWTDYPAELTADIVLVNDLDLLVTGPNGEIWSGNNFTGFSDDGEEYPIYDRQNNHEQVDIRHPSPGTYTVLVRGHHVPHGPQCYALVATGDFTQLAEPGEVTCANECSGHGTCVTGECRCHGMFAGVDCGLAVEPLVSGAPAVQGVVEVDDWDYYAFDLGPHGGGGFTVTMTRTSSVGDPDMYIKHGSAPSYVDVTNVCKCEAATKHNCECRELSCDSCDEHGTGRVPRVLESDGQQHDLKGVYIVGVTGFCCDAAHYTISVQLHVKGCDGVDNSGKVEGCDGVCGSGLEVDECGTCGGNGQCVGCDGVEGSDKVEDVCGVCDGDGSTCAGCDGVAASGAVDDECGVCGGDGSSCAGCDGVPNSGAEEDVCGVCAGDGSSCAGCDGVPGSGAQEDACGVCLGNGTTCAGCDGIPNSGAVEDACGVCGGDGSSCAGCDGVPNSGAVLDVCGECGGDGSTCIGCDGVPGSGVKEDACGVCGGDGMTCAGCDGVPNSGLVEDACGVCGGDNTTCAGCDGVPNSGKTEDECGVCGGDGSSCAGCDGVPNSGLALDECGVCGGDSTTCEGCDGVANSGLEVDGCGVCGGDGSTCAGCDGVPQSGLEVDKCGVCGGTGEWCLECDGDVDECGVCDGDGSSCAWVKEASRPIRIMTSLTVSGMLPKVIGVEIKEMLATSVASVMGVEAEEVAVKSVMPAVAKAGGLGRRLLGVSSSRGHGASGSVMRADEGEGVMRRTFLVSVAVVLQRGEEVLPAVKHLQDGIKSGLLNGILSQTIQEDVTAVLTFAPVYEEYSTTLGTSLAVEQEVEEGVAILLLYWMIGAAVGLMCHRRPPTDYTSPYTACMLWAAFGLVGAHRFYTRTPRVGVVYLCTFGLLGIGWLGDLYWQRRFFFTSGNRAKAQQMANRIKNSRIGTAIRSKTSKRKYQRGLTEDDDADDDDDDGQDTDDLAIQQQQLPSSPGGRHVLSPKTAVLGGPEAPGAKFDEDDRV